MMNILMKNSKKGMAINFMVQMVVVILAFVLIAMVINKFMGGAEDLAAEGICHDSVALRAATVLQLGKAQLTTTPLLCKTIDKKIKGDREEVLMEVSDSMARCWWMYNEGLYDNQAKDLGLETFHELFGISSTNSECTVCYSLAIDSEDLDENPITASELMDYVRETEYKNGNSYLEYIQSGGGPGHIMILDNIENGGSYGTTFLPKNSMEGDWSWVGYAVGGAAFFGTAVCIIAEPCGAIAAGVLGVTAVGAGTFSHYKNYQKVKEKYIYGDEATRDVSIVSIDNLNDVQAAKCYEGDVAGK